MEKFVNDYIKSLKDYEPVESDSTLRSKYSLGNKEIIRLNANAVSYTHLRAHETRGNVVCRLLL